MDSSNQVPSGDTLGRFRNLLIQNGLQEQLFEQVVAMLMERGLILKKGTIVDSTIVRAKVEHVFGVVKGLLKFKKTRYRGLRKQEAKFNIMFALANLILADRPCLAV